MSVSNFSTPSPIAVDLDLYVADVRLTASDRADTTAEIRPANPDRPADVKAADSTRVEYDDATRTLTIISRKPRSRFVNFSGKRPESIDVLIALPSGSAVRGEAGLGDFTADGELGTVDIKTGLGIVRLAATGPLTARTGSGEITAEHVTGPARVHAGSGEIRLGTIDGTADISSSNGPARIGTVTGTATVKCSNGTPAIGRALSDLTAASSNGDVRIGEVIRGTVTATSKNGSVEIGIRDGSTAWLDVTTEVGRVYNELAATDPPGEGEGDGDGEGDRDGEPVDKVQVHASTKLGNITIRRAPRLED